MFPIRFTLSPSWLHVIFQMRRFETIRGIDGRSKCPISLKNLIHLNGVRPLQKWTKKSVDDGKDGSHYSKDDDEGIVVTSLSNGIVQRSKLSG